jgi:two-component system, OmpR family, sensor histidine kinase CpxA
VTISATRREIQVVVRVSDEGPGVPGELLQRVFDPFFRAETSRSRDTGGTGLGLAIVKTCVEACGGIIAARNREPRGFEVEMTLEAAQ